MKRFEKYNVELGDGKGRADRFESFERSERFVRCERFDKVGKPFKPFRPFKLFENPQEKMAIGPKNPDKCLKDIGN